MNRIPSLNTGALRASKGNESQPCKSKPALVQGEPSLHAEARRRKTASCASKSSRGNGVNI